MYVFSSQLHAHKRRNDARADLPRIRAFEEQAQLQLTPNTCFETKMSLRTVLPRTGSKIREMEISTASPEYERGFTPTPFWRCDGRNHPRTIRRREVLLIFDEYFVEFSSY